MSREYNIAWNKNQLSRLNSATRRYNNAIRKASRLDPNANVYLPNELSYQELKKSITTARALNNTVSALVRATKKGALAPRVLDDGGIISQYEYGEYNILKRTRERKKSILRKQAGAQTALERAELTPDNRKASSMSSNTLKRFIETQTKEMNTSNVERAQKYFTNYTKALYTVFGGFEDYDKRIEHIQEIILRVAGEDFNVLKKAIYDAPSIKFIYDPIARNAKMDIIYNYWLKVNDSFGSDISFNIKSGFKVKNRRHSSNHGIPEEFRNLKPDNKGDNNVRR